MSQDDFTTGELFHLEAEQRRHLLMATGLTKSSAELRQVINNNPEEYLEILSWRDLTTLLKSMVMSRAISLGESSAELLIIRADWTHKKMRLQQLPIIRYWGVAIGVAKSVCWG
jgi:hypothetical protein